MEKADAIIFFGSKKKLATVLGISQAAISQWGRVIPPLRAYQLEQLTNGKLKASDLSLPSEDAENLDVGKLQN